MNGGLENIEFFGNDDWILTSSYIRKIEHSRRDIIMRKFNYN